MHSNLDQVEAEPFFEKLHYQTGKHFFSSACLPEDERLFKEVENLSPCSRLEMGLKIAEHIEERIN